MRTKIRSILQDPSYIEKTLTLKGWVRTVRTQKTFSFLELNDGSSLASLQIVLESTLPGYTDLLEKITTGASIAVTGTVVASPAHKQKVELHAHQIEVIGLCDPETYPLQKKRHSFEFLRTLAHLRPRTNTLGAVMRVRNALAYATHTFFEKRGFLYIHTPIITASDCEGAGKMFQVTTLDPLADSPEKDYAYDFFGKKAFLTVSGQLNGEIYASALGDIYTFGPTFRAENSNTARHLAEFWMIEPEMAFADLQEDMELAEQFLKALFAHVLETCPEDMEFFDRFILPGATARLRSVVEQPFERITYTQAIALLEKSTKKFQFPFFWGSDLQSEHERYLCEELFNKPVIVTDYPAAIKAFYMRANEDEKTVAAMDVLVPHVGEIIGGSQREERWDVLCHKMDRLGLDKEAYSWYLDLRKYGTVPHAGFGAGFERLVQFATGMENIRDVIPFPRTPGHADF